MSQNKELASIKNKIKALTNRVVGNGCTEAEALSAMQMVGKLLLKYNLDMSEIDLREEKCVKIEIKTDAARRRPVDNTMVALANFCDCKVWFTKQYDPEIGSYATSYCIFGFEADTQMANYLYHVIDTAMETAVNEYKGSDEYYFLSPGKKRSASHSFLLGMARRISTRLTNMHAERVAELKAQQSKTGTSLVVVKAATVNEEFNKMKLKLRSVSGSSRIRNASSYHRGVAAGDRVNLNRPVGDDTGSTLKLK